VLKGVLPEAEVTSKKLTMRIAILGDALDLQYAGIHIYLQGLLKALMVVDTENEYLLVRPKAGGEFDRMEEIIIPVSRSIPGHQRLRAFTSIPRILTQKNVDIVLEPAHFGPFMLPGRVRRITIIHDLTPVLFPEWHPLTSSLVQKIALPFVLKKADRIIANSTHTEKDIWQQYPFSKEKTSVLMPGREAVFQPVQDEVVLAKYGIRKPYLLYTGTIEPRKNLLTLLRAYEEFRRKQGEPVQLVLSGKKGWKNDPLFAALETSTFRQDVVLTGYVERRELPALYSMARLFIYPSLYEGFGLPVLEAMSCGAPVLIAQTSSLPEVGGDAAAYFDPRSQEELAGKLLDLNLNEDKRQKMSGLSVEQASRFNWETSARHLVSIFQKLSGGSKSHIYKTA
jgi:glycosyltransferase involved in cell wall biosynthesis